MTTSAAAVATGVLVAGLALAGCSFSGDVRASGGSATSPRTSAPSREPETAPPAPPATTAPPSSSGAPADPPDEPAPPPGAVSPQPGTSTSTGTGTGTAGSQAAVPERCSSDRLGYDVPVPQGGGGGSASSTTAVVLTNVGDRACTLFGYPGVSFVAGEDRRTAGAPADRQPGTTPARVVLAPGGTASAELTIAAEASVGDGVCQPTDVVGLRIFPPGSTGSALVDRRVTACGGPDAHQLVVGPVQPG